MEHGIYGHGLGTWISGKSAFCGMLDGGTKGAEVCRAARVTPWTSGGDCENCGVGCIYVAFRIIPTSLPPRTPRFVARAGYVCSFFTWVNWATFFFFSQPHILGNKYNVHLKGAVV